MEQSEQRRRDDRTVWGMDVDTYCAAMHLSQFLNVILPIAGIAAPVLMWSLNRDQDPRIDAHGKALINWLLSLLIYATVSAILVFVLIGGILLLVLGVVSVVFAVLGAVKASQGAMWEYPMSIRFVAVPGLKLGAPGDSLG
jgi:uncharacterized protein